MEMLKQTILTNWNLMRWIRLLFGVALIVQGIYLRDMVPGLAGIWFSYVALLNVSCCGVGGCDISHPSSTEISTQNINNSLTFEEVKQK